MGKRELLLVAAFVILGGIVYQLTAPPTAPGEQGFSISRIIDSVRREVRGNRASAQHRSTAAHPIDAATTEVRVTLRSGPLAIVGEERSDVATELVVTSTGFDEAEAAKLATATTIKFDQAGSILFVSVDFPTPGSQRVRGLSIKVPARVVVRMVESNSGKLEISNVAGVELGQARGETIIRQISGRVTATHRGGDFGVTDAGSVRLTTRGSDVTLGQIRGEATLSTQAGALETTGIAGPLELESNGTDVTLEGLETATGALRVNATGGSVEMRGLRTESRVDVRNADVALSVDRPAAIAVHSEGGEPVTLTLPAGGFNLDALSREASISTSPADLPAKWGFEITTSESGETQASGAINGGGPLITIRTRQGAITLSAPGDAQTKPGTEK